jgi:hypothetical protein
MNRTAKLEDIPRVLELLQAAHRRTIYASVGNVSPIRARELVEEMGARMVSPGLAKTFFQVAQASGKVEGFLIGYLEPIYSIGDKAQATDLFTLLNEGKADPKDFIRMLTAFNRWAEMQQDVIQLQTGVNDIMGTDWPRLVPVYEKLGYEKTGVILTKRFK